METAMSLGELEPGNVPKGRRKSLNKRTKPTRGAILTALSWQFSRGRDPGSGGQLWGPEMGADVPGLWACRAWFAT